MRAEQLGIQERLGQVVVGPAGEDADAVGVAAAAAEDDHRNVRVDAAGESVGRANAVQQLQAVAILEHQVQDHERRAAHLDRPQGLPHAVAAAKR